MPLGVQGRGGDTAFVAAAEAEGLFAGTLVLRTGCTAIDIYSYKYKDKHIANAQTHIPVCVNVVV